MKEVIVVVMCVLLASCQEVAKPQPGYKSNSIGYIKCDNCEVVSGSSGSDILMCDTSQVWSSKTIIEEKPIPNKQYSYGGTTYTVYKHHVVMKGLINGTGRTPNGVLIECPDFIIKSKNDSVYVELKKK